ncbi:hypothetical protein GCM10023149_48890 [Mucilaginibacter gynuensis]|uniref:Quorum-sensing-regulated virulence factor n=1 Tax=Mucilaginibacter gynuensis TaxID=1302236 RepID=A0ABP8HG86_9SPHI
MEPDVFTDKSLMPFGQYKGQRLIDVPASYLIWLYRNERAGKLKTYIQDNFDALLKETNKSKK